MCAGGPEAQEAARACNDILADKNHDLWETNSDYDTYQEKAWISETGLAPANPGRVAAGVGS